MFENRLKEELSNPAKVLFNNKFNKEILEKNANKDKIYLQLGFRIFRLMMLADVIYKECLKKRVRMSGPNKEFAALQFELFFFIFTHNL